MLPKTLLKVGGRSESRHPCPFVTDLGYYEFLYRRSFHAGGGLNSDALWAPGGGISQEFFEGVPRTALQRF